MSRICLISMLIFSIVNFAAPYVFGDVVYFDNNKVEGRIVMETPFVIIVETYIGKVTIEKNKVTDVVRLEPEENFFNIGNYHFDKKRYDRAIEYYNKALEVNPGYEKAKEAISKTEETQKYIELKRKLELERLDKERQEKKEIVEKEIGLSVDKKGTVVEVTHVKRRSVAGRAKIKPRDRIIAINNSSTEGMIIEEVCEQLLAKRPMLLTIEREFKVARKSIEYKKSVIIGVGMFLEMDEKGPFVSNLIEGKPADVAGIKREDRIIEVDGEKTEGLSMDEVAALIDNGELTKIKILIRREVQIK